MKSKQLFRYDISCLFYMSWKQILILFIMATREMTFIFPDEEMFNEAKQDFEQLMYDDYRYSDKIDFYYGYAYRIDIMSECSDIERAASICRRHRGKFVADPR